MKRSPTLKDKSKSPPGKKKGANNLKVDTKEVNKDGKD